MPFGLCNKPATFQQTMNVLLADCLAFACVYTDNIVIFLRKHVEHVEHIWTVFQKLCAEKLFAKRKKCIFAQPAIEFCGFLVRANGIRSMSDKGLLCRLCVLSGYGCCRIWLL